MKKSMYSLILSSDIVNKIDKLAYSNKTNRSNMINRILAEYVNYRTPEMRVSDIFDIVERSLSEIDKLSVMMRNSDTMLSVRSPLEFKYNPTIKYNVELYRSAENVIGELRVSLRTQNPTLLLYLMQFFKLWTKIEAKYLSGSEYSIHDGKFEKKLLINEKYSITPLSDEMISEAIVDYVVTFDTALKTFFYNTDNPSSALIQVEAVYADYVTNTKIRL